VIAIDFGLEKATVTSAALGGAAQIDLSYKKFPSLANVPISELEQLGAALTLVIANIDHHVTSVALNAAAKMARELQGPELIVPSDQLVLAS
jgi:hypothetical protein